MNGPSTLIIWEEIPENTRFFLIPNVVVNTVTHPNLLESIASANSYFINTKGEGNVRGLQNFLFDEEGECIRPELEVKSENGKLLFDNVEITRVCHTGFIL